MIGIILHSGFRFTPSPSHLERGCSISTTVFPDNLVISDPLWCLLWGWARAATLHLGLGPSPAILWGKYQFGKIITAIFKEVEVRLRLRWYKTGKNYNFAKEELRIAGSVDGDWRCVEVRVAAEAGSIRSQDCDHSNLWFPPCPHSRDAIDTAAAPTWWMWLKIPPTDDVSVSCS